MKIGVLQAGRLPADLVPEFGDYQDIFTSRFEPHGFELSNYLVVDGQFPTGVDAEQGWIITGSRHGTYEPHDWIPPLERFIREARRANKAMVGICFGHQIMAQALGGTVQKADQGWGIGNHAYTHSNTAEAIKLIALHQDQVVEKPADTDIFLASQFCPIAGLCYGDNTVSVQPHPEFSASFTRALIVSRRGNVMPENAVDAALGDIDAVNDSERMIARLGLVLRGQGYASRSAA